MWMYGAKQHDHAIAILQFEVIKCSTDFGGLFKEVTTLRSASASVCQVVAALSMPIAARLSDSVSQQFLNCESGNCSVSCSSIFSGSPALSAAVNFPFHSAGRFADHFKLSGVLRRVPGEGDFSFFGVSVVKLFIRMKFDSDQTVI
jgi:hypothetical protein